jgi:S-adenosylmethionine/arginine decarboxylase-like enzyme
MQLPARVQQLSATANAVLFDFDRHNSYQFQTLRQSLHEAIGKGKMMPLRPHMHRYGGKRVAASCQQPA